MALDSVSKTQRDENKRLERTVSNYYSDMLSLPFYTGHSCQTLLTVYNSLSFGNSTSLSPWIRPLELIPFRSAYVQSVIRSFPRLTCGVMGENSLGKLVSHFPPENNVTQDHYHRVHELWTIYNARPPRNKLEPTDTISFMMPLFAAQGFERVQPWQRMIALATSP